MTTDPFRRPAMSTEQRRALADMIPTTEVIKDAVTYPRERLGEPLDISAERFEAWLRSVRRDAARSALLGAEQHIRANMDEPYGDRAANRVADYARTYRPEETP